MNHKAPTADCSGSVAAEVDEGAFVGVREHYAVLNMARRAIEAFTSAEVLAERWDHCGRRACPRVDSLVRLELLEVS
jgi:hypothetical protein